MHHKVKCKYQQFHEVAGFLLSSSLCSKRRVNGWLESAHCWESRSGPARGAAWISWGSCPVGIRSKPVAGGGGRDKSTGLRGGSPAAVWSAEWEGTVKAMEPSTSLPRVLPARVGRPAKSAKRSNHVAGHGPEAHIPHAGAGARRTPWSYTLSRIVCPFCPYSWIMGMNVLILCEMSASPQPGEGLRHMSDMLPVHGPR